MENRLTDHHDGQTYVLVSRSTFFWHTWIIKHDTKVISNMITWHRIRCTCTLLVRKNCQWLVSKANKLLLLLLLWLELNSMYYIPQICRFFLFAELWHFATRYQLLRPGRVVRTFIGVNEWLEHDSFEFTKYCFPEMCRFLLFCYEIKQPLWNLAITWMWGFLLVCSKIK